MRYRRTFLIACVVSILGIWRLDAFQTKMPRLNIDELTNASSHVVLGRVQSIQSSYTSDRTRVITEIRVQIDEVVKGSIGEGSIRLLMPGGTIDGRTTIVVGAPAFAVGEEAVLFLGRLKKKNTVDVDRFSLTGLSQGKFSVRYSEKRRKRIAISEASKTGFPLMPDALGRTEAEGGGAGLTLEDFLQQIPKVFTIHPLTHHDLNNLKNQDRCITSYRKSGDISAYDFGHKKESHLAMRGHICSYDDNPGSRIEMA